MRKCSNDFGSFSFKLFRSKKTAKLKGWVELLLLGECNGGDRSVFEVLDSSGATTSVVAYITSRAQTITFPCLLYTSDAADE